MTHTPFRQSLSLTINSMPLMENGKDQRAICSSFLAKDDVILATGYTQISPMSENCFRAGIPFANRFKVRVKNADIADRLVNVLFLNRVADDPGDVAIGQVGKFEIRHASARLQSVFHKRLTATRLDLEILGKPRSG